MVSKPLIDDKVFDQIMQVRDSGKVNMCSVKEVQYHAFHMNLYELVNFIESYPKEYFHFILTGDRGEAKEEQ
jgi:hypothetical protein